MKKKNSYIAVMGTMGVGKTTVARLLAKELKFHLLEENFGENAFLPRFYKDMKKWAFHSQTFYLMEKINQMMQTATLLQASSVIQDTPIQQDVFSYAKAQHVLGNIDDDEWRLYMKIYSSFAEHLPTPTCIIYLSASLSEIKNRINHRGRSYEMKIPASYLELLDMLNQKFLSSNKSIPILTIDTDGKNIIRNLNARREVVEAIMNGL